MALGTFRTWYLPFTAPGGNQVVSHPPAGAIWASKLKWPPGSAKQLHYLFGTELFFWLGYWASLVTLYGQALPKACSSCPDWHQHMPFGLLESPSVGCLVAQVPGPQHRKSQHHQRMPGSSGGSFTSSFNPKYFPARNTPGQRTALQRDTGPCREMGVRHGFCSRGLDKGSKPLTEEEAKETR